MRRVVTGTTADGLSTVVVDESPGTVLHIAPGEVPVVLDTGWAGGALRPGEVVVHDMWKSDAKPSTAEDSPPGDADTGFDVAWGATKWIVTEMGPDLDAPMHQTATVDYGLVVRGVVTLILQTGDVLLSAGDGVVIAGVQHGWRAGPEGCVIATVLVGLPREDH